MSTTRVDVLIIAENSVSVGDLDIADVITRTRAREPRTSGTFEVECVTDLDDLDLGVARALKRYRGRTGEKTAMLGRVDIVGHGTPGALAIGPKAKDELKASSVSQLQSLTTRDPQAVRLLGCDTGVVVDAVGQTRHGPVTMLAIAEFLKVPVLGMLTSLRADDFDDNGVHEHALEPVDGVLRSWTIDPKTVRPTHPDADGQRVARPLPVILAPTDALVGSAKVELRTEDGRKVVVPLGKLRQAFGGPQLDGRGLLYKPYAWGKIGARRVEILGACEYLRFHDGEQRVAFARTTDLDTLLRMLRGERSKRG